MNIRFLIIGAALVAIGGATIALGNLTHTQQVQQAAALAQRSKNHNAALPVSLSGAPSGVENLTLVARYRAEPPFVPMSQSLMAWLYDTGSAHSASPPSFIPSASQKNLLAARAGLDHFYRSKGITAAHITAFHVRNSARMGDVAYTIFSFSTTWQFAKGKRPETVSHVMSVSFKQKGAHWFAVSDQAAK